MTRTLLCGGRVFDGTGAPPAAADVLVEDGRILEVGPGLDGDEAVDVGGRHLLPGLFDCHTHVTLSSIDLMRHAPEAVLLPLLRDGREPGRDPDSRHHRVRERGGADPGSRGRGDGLVPGPRLQISMTLLTQTGGHGDGWYPCGAGARLLARLPGHARRPGRRARGHAPQGPRAGQGGRRRHQGRDQRRRPVPDRRPPPRPLPRRRAGRPGRRGGRRRPLGDGPRPGAATASRRPSGPGSARSSTASTSTTRPSS